MSSNRRSTPRSRIEELKALRKPRKKRPSTSRHSGKLNNSANVSNYVKQEISPKFSAKTTSKQVVPMIPVQRLHTQYKPRRKPNLNLTNPSLNSTLNSSRRLNLSQRTVAPQPPENPKNDSFTRSKYAVPQETEMPFSALSALKKFKEQLSDYEKAEILDYKEVYYMGLRVPKEKLGSGPNFGFDDEKGDYKLYKGDHIAFRFEIKKLLGKGSFGQVCECFDHKKKETVAIKIIKNQKRFEHQAGVEIKVLHALKSRDPNDTNNVIHMKSYFVFRKHICISFELLNSNLYDLLKLNKFKGLSLNLLRRFAVQILLALKYCQKLKIVHCDLKPENILLKQPNKSGIKVIDFGSACFESEKVYTYIQSRFYRAPEIILGIEYTTAIDMWSLGCMLAELYLGKPLMPGESEYEQLQLIMQLRGLPSASLLRQGTRIRNFFAGNEPKLKPNSSGKVHLPATKNLKACLGCKDDNFTDFVDKCLTMDPQQRMTPEQGLQHPWVVEGMKNSSSKSPRKVKHIPTVKNLMFSS